MMTGDEDPCVHHGAALIMIADLNRQPAESQKRREECVRLLSGCQKERVRLTDQLEESEQECDRLRERLEIDCAYDLNGNKIPFPEGSPDGIACRDVYIQVLKQDLLEVEQGIIRKREELTDALTDSMYSESKRIENALQALAAKDNPALDVLIAAARNHVMTPDERRSQVISFAYGNLAIENPSITREMIETAYDLAAKEKP